MERALRVMNDFVAKVNEERANERYDRANEYLDMLCGAMCVFNEYELGNRRQITLGETNNRVWIQVVEA